MKHSLLLASLLAVLAAGCSTTDINEPMGLNAPFPELESRTSDGSHMVLFTYKDYGKLSKIGTVSINGLKMTPIDVGSESILESTWGPLPN